MATIKEELEHLQAKNISKFYIVYLTISLLAATFSVD